MMYDIETKRKRLVGNWFYNLKNNIENEDILFITSYKNNMKFSDLVKKFIYNNVDANYKEEIKYYILDFKQSKENRKLSAKRNLIIVESPSIRFDIRLAELFSIKKILCYNFRQKIDLDSIDSYSEKPTLTHDEKDLIYINMFEPSTLIHQPKSKIESFISNMYGEYPFFKETNIINLIKDTNLDYEEQYLYKRNTSISDILNLKKNYLLKDVIILKEKNILTSRLSIFLYRKALFNVDANITEIGRYFSKYIGSKSKTIDLTKISIDSSTNYNSLTKTKVKAYDLNVKPKNEIEIKNEVELETKIHIAKKLLYFTDIDEKTISKIIELPLSIIKKYK